MKRASSVLADRELVAMLTDTPDLLAVADALVETTEPPVVGRVPRAVHGRRWRAGVAFASALSAAAAMVLALLFSPWAGGPPLEERALAAIGRGEVLHVAFTFEGEATPTIDLRTGSALERNTRVDLWLDDGRQLRKSEIRIDGRVLDEQLVNRDGGWSTTGRIYTCKWIAAHPAEAAAAGVACNPGRDESPLLGVDRALTVFADRYEQALKSGEATISGSGEIDGRPVVWLVFPWAEDLERVAVDKRTYEPVRLEGPSVSYNIVAAERVPYDSSKFARPAPVGARAATPEIDGPTDPQSAAAALGGNAFWLGPRYGTLDIRSTSRGGAGADEAVVRFEYGVTSTAKPAIVLYESRACYVSLGWTCGARDPHAPMALGLPFGDRGLVGVVKRGDLYISIWNRSGQPQSLTEIAKALQPVAAR